VLTYNIFIFIVAVLLMLDYYVHQYDVHLQNGGTRLSFGNTFMYLALAVIIFFAGFRFEIGDDYQKYLAGYMFDDELRHWEPLFNFFVRLIRGLNFDMGTQAMFLFFSALTIVILYKALNILTPYYRFSILLYLLIPSLYLNSFSVIRQGIALVILLYGFQYIAKDYPDYKKYLMTAFIAFMFHYSSAFVAVIYLFGSKLLRNKYSWLFYTSLIVISFFLSFAHIGKIVLVNMPGHFSFYANNLGYTVSPLKLLTVNVFFLFFMFQKDKFIQTTFDKYALNSIFLGLLVFNVFSDFVFVSRLAQYFLSLQIILVPIYIYSLKDMLIRKVMFILFLLYYLFNFNYALYREMIFHGAATLESSHGLVPYKNYFFEEKKPYRTQNLDAWYNYILNLTEEQQERKGVE